MPAPPPADLASLPLWGQISALIALAGGITVAVRNGLKPKAAATSDSVVVSGAFADAQPIRELLAAVRGDEAATRELTAAVERFSSRAAASSSELRAAVEAMQHCQRETNGHLEEIGVAISKGVSVKIAPNA